MLIEDYSPWTDSLATSNDLPMLAQVEIKTAFGIALREARTRAKLSQEQLALEVGLDRTFISLLERGKRQPSLCTLFTLAEKLDVSASELVEYVENSLAG